MVEIKNLYKKYGEKEALKDINLEFGKGEIIGLFGENGAGKTTLIKSILNLVRYEGEITLDGEKITRQNIGKFSFATCEHSFFPGLSAEGHKIFYQEQFETFNEKRFDGLMEFFQLPMKKPIRSFSTGQKNQFEVIMALSQGADYILMDEPFAGNDVFNREDFYKVLLGILEPHETILLSTHLIEEVENIITRAVLIRKGELVGDVEVSELEEKGIKLIDYIKETYEYKRDRVSQAILDITGEGEPEFENKEKHESKNKTEFESETKTDIKIEETIGVGAVETELKSQEKTGETDEIGEMAFMEKSLESARNGGDLHA